MFVEGLLGNATVYKMRGEPLELLLGLTKLGLKLGLLGCGIGGVVLDPKVQPLQGPGDQILLQADALEVTLDVNRDLGLAGSWSTADHEPSSPSSAAVVGELALDELAGQHPAAESAAKKAGVEEGVAGRVLMGGAVHHGLYQVELLPRDHGEMFAGVRDAKAHHFPGVEGVTEQFVEVVEGRWTTRTVSRGSAREAPVVGGETPDLGGGQPASDELTPSALHDGKAIRIGYDHGRATVPGVVALLHVAQGRATGDAAIFVDGLVAAPDTDREVVGHLGGCTEEHGQHELGVTTAGVGALGGHELLQMTLTEVMDEGTTVDGVSGQAIELPSEDTQNRPTGDLLQELGEHGPARFAGRLVLGELLVDGESKPSGKLAHFCKLGWDRENLLILPVCGLAGIENGAGRWHRVGS